MEGNIIALAGFKRSGKDTIGKVIKYKDHSFKRLAFADEVKKEFSKIEGIKIEEVEKNKDYYRDKIIELGEEKREIDPRYWIVKAFNDIDIGNTKENIVITDVRRIEELKYLNEKKKYNNNIKVVEVIRPFRWDEDIETVKAMLYGTYYNIFDERIVNDQGHKELKDVSEAFYEKLKQDNIGKINYYFKEEENQKSGIQGPTEF